MQTNGAHQKKYLKKDPKLKLKTSVIEEYFGHKLPQNSITLVTCFITGWLFLTRNTETETQLCLSLTHFNLDLHKLKIQKTNY